MRFMTVNFKQIYKLNKVDSFPIIQDFKDRQKNACHWQKKFYAAKELLSGQNCLTNQKQNAGADRDYTLP